MGEGGGKFVPFNGWAIVFIIHLGLELTCSEVGEEANESLLFNLKLFTRKHSFQLSVLNSL